MSALPEKEVYTIEDIDALPEGRRAELIDGVIYDMATPSRLHQRISGAVFNVIYDYITENKGECEVYAAPFAVFLNGMEDEYNYLEPDISVICDPDKLNDKGCDGAPDWIIEIVSPSTAPNDYLFKFRKYQTAGVKEYWIIDPQAEKVIVTVFAASGKSTAYPLTAAIPVFLYPGLTICLKS